MSKEKLSEEQVYDVMKFSNALYGYLQNGIWSPQTQNDALIHLNNNQKEATYQDVIDALSRSLSNAEDIQGYSEFMNVFDTIYSKTLEYYLIYFHLIYRGLVSMHMGKIINQKNIKPMNEE